MAGRKVWCPWLAKEVPVRFCYDCDYGPSEEGLLGDDNIRCHYEGGSETQAKAQPE